MQTTCGVFIRLAAIGQLNDATYDWNSPGYTAKVCVIVYDRRPTTEDRRRVVPSFHYNYGKLRPARNSCFSSVTNGLSAATPGNPRQLERAGEQRRSLTFEPRVCFTFVLSSSSTSLAKLDPLACVNKRILLVFKR